MDVRSKTRELVETDFEAALKFAEGIEDDWNRVQSLAIVARHTKDRARFVKIVTAALSAARQMSDPNRMVSSSAWVVSAMVAREDVDVSPTVNDLLEVIAHEPNPVRRTDALLVSF